MLDKSSGPDHVVRKVWRPDLRRYLGRLGGRPCPPELVAREALRGVERNLPLIITPARARATIVIYRHFPALVEAIGRLILETELRRKS